MVKLQNDVAQALDARAIQSQTTRAAIVDEILRASLGLSETTTTFQKRPTISYDEYKTAIVAILREHGPMTRQQCLERLYHRFGDKLTDIDMEHIGQHRRWHKAVDWCKQELMANGVLQRSRGWSLTHER